MLDDFLDIMVEKPGVFESVRGDEIERALVGAAIDSEHARTRIRAMIGHLPVFQNTEYRLIWDAVLEVERLAESRGTLVLRGDDGEPLLGLDGKPLVASGVNPAFVCDYLGSKSHTSNRTQLGAVGGAAAVFAICRDKAMGDYEAMCQRLIALYKMRVLKNGFQRITDACSPTATPEQVFALVEKLRSEVEQSGEKTLESIHSKAISRQVKSHVINTIDNQGADRLHCGMDPVDALVDGFGEDWYVVLSSYSKHAKTTLAAAILAGFASRKDRPIVNIHQCEVRQVTQAARVLAAHHPSARVCQQWILKADRVPKGQQNVFLAKLNEALKWLEETDIYFEDPGAIRFEHIVSRVRQLRALYPERKLVCVVDYIQRIRMEGRFSSRRDELEMISAGLLDLAKQQRCLMLVLSQYTDGDVMSAPIPMPRAGQVRQCKDIRNDVDLLLGWHRPYAFAARYQDLGILEVSAGRELETSHVLMKADLGRGYFGWWQGFVPDITGLESTRIKEGDEKSGFDAGPEWEEVVR